jgi:hypothetical protein
MDTKLAGCAKTQTASHEGWVQSQANPCGISGGKSGKQQGFSPSNSVFLYQDHFTNNSSIMDVI